MKKRWTALILALALVFAFGAGAVLADDEEAEPIAEAAEPAETVETAEAAAGEGAAEAGTAAAEPEQPAADAAGALSFANLRGRMLENYYPLLALQENIDALDELDYEKMEEDLRNGLNRIAMQQSAALMTPMLGSMLYETYEPQYTALREQFDAVRNGELQADNEGVKHQLRNLQDQTVIVAESLYITRKGLEAQDAALTRQLAALDRNIRTAQLSYERGLTPELTVRQLTSGREQLASGQKTLRMNMENILLQLKAMTGTDLDAPLALAALPKVTAQQLSAMDLEADFAKAKGASYELYDAKQTYDDAKEAYDDAVDEYGLLSKKNEFMNAKHTWQAAQYTYENARQSYELKFRTLYAQVKDYAQALDAARSALSLEEKNYAVSALKCEQGTISRNALADAADTLANAKDAAAGAERDLFTAYRNYYWAVEYGILN